MHFISIQKSFLFILLVVLPQKLDAKCNELFSGNAVMDVKSCRYVTSATEFPKTNKNYSWIYNLSRNEQLFILSNYNGNLLKGTIISSSPKSKSNKTKRLDGEIVNAFNISGSNECQQLLNKRVNITLQQQCCDGRANSPCLLKTSYIVLDKNPIGKVMSHIRDVLNDFKSLDPENAKILDSLSKKEYKLATRGLAKKIKKNNSDIVSLYLLSYTLKEDGKCYKALPSLRKLSKLWEKGALKGSMQPIANESMFLLARCYAILRKSLDAYGILKIFLSNPKEFSIEIEKSLTHKDFSWIKNTKHYQDFVKQANSMERKPY